MYVHFTKSDDAPIFFKKVPTKTQRDRSGVSKIG